MITLETSTETVFLLTLLVSDGAMSLHGVPATTSRGVKGKLTNICSFSKFFLPDITTPTTLMSPAGDSLEFTIVRKYGQIQIVCEC